MLFDSLCSLALSFRGPYHFSLHSPPLFCRHPADSSHNTFASGGSDGFISIWDHSAKKRMKLYSKYPTAISALAFSPDGTKLAIGASYEHDNAVAEAERGMNLVFVKETVMEDCKVSRDSARPSVYFASETTRICEITADVAAKDESVNQNDAKARRRCRSGKMAINAFDNQ